MIMGNMMNSTEKLISSSDQFEIYQFIYMKNTLQKSTFVEVCSTI